MLHSESEENKSATYQGAEFSLTPIALFVYNRPWHTCQTIEALQKNALAIESDLIIYSDAPKLEAHADAVSQVRLYIHQLKGFKSITIIERKENFGLARSIIDGVTSTVNEYGRVIVLEDDLVTSPYFLQFMNDGLRVYEQNKDVASIHAYVYPIDDLPEIFFMRGADCWGWATWKDRWEMFEFDGAKLLNELKHMNLTRRFDFNGTYPYTRMLADQISGKNNSWAIRWHASAFLKNKFTLYPGTSLILNIGHDGSGEHCGVTDGFSSDVAMSPVHVVPVCVEETDHSFKMFERFFKSKRIRFIVRVRRLIGKISRKFN